MMAIYLKNLILLGVFGTCLALVTACGHTPVSSLIKLRNFDPATTDVNKLSVAVILPPEFKVSQEGVTMVLELKKKDGSDLKREEFKLVNSVRSEDHYKLNQLDVQGRKIVAYRVAPNDVDRFNSIRQFTLQARATEQWEGSFSIGAKACRLNEQLPKTILTTIYLKSSETKDYVPFAVDLDLMKQASEDELASSIPICELT